jgi:hypothetical protein
MLTATAPAPDLLLASVAVVVGAAPDSSASGATSSIFVSAVVRGCALGSGSGTEEEDPPCDEVSRRRSNLVDCRSVDAMSSGRASSGRDSVGSR